MIYKKLEIPLLALVLAVPAPAFSSDNTVLKLLTRRYDVMNVNHFTSIEASETAGILDGQLYYISAANLSGTSPVYRLYQSGIVDHMDSMSTNEGGYSLEGTLGYSFNSPASFLAPIGRWYNYQYADHMTGFSDEDPTMFGYAFETNLGYGFPRYGQTCESNYTISAGGVSISANKVAGGAISELTWNGKQFINNFDYGRQIQIAFNFTNNAEEDNPNEAGSYFGCPGIVDASYAHGSPIIYVTSSGSTLFTKTHPLQWFPQNWGGNSDMPVMWNGTIAKEVTLNYAVGYDAHVIKWTSILDVPSADVTESGDWELVTAYPTSDFNRFYTFDAEVDVLTERTSSVPNNACSVAPLQEGYMPDSGGVINATANGAYALGVFRTRSGGNKNHFAQCKFLNNQGGGKYGGDATKWSAMGRDDDVPGVKAGINTGTAYLVVGTLADVASTMREMYLDGF